MSDLDARGYRKAKYKSIFLYMLAVYIIATVCIIILPVNAIFFVLFAVGSGWQMGVLTERNYWDEWYKKQGHK